MKRIKSKIIIILISCMIAMNITQVIAVLSSNVEIDTVNGYTTKKVIVPILFSQLPDVNNCDFIVKFDPNNVEVLSVTAGEIIESPATDFKHFILQNLGIISFVFIDETQELRSITQDGVFANIEVEVKEEAQTGFSPITYFTEQTFGKLVEGGIEQINGIEFLEGGIEIYALAIDQLQVDDEQYSLEIGGTHQTQVDALYNSSDVVNVTDKATYFSDDNSIATVNSDGLVTAISAGDAKITMDYEGVQKEVQVHVLNDISVLAGIYLNGQLFNGFDSEQFQYDYEVPYGEDVPTVTVQNNYNATVQVSNTQVDGLLQKTEITVVSEDGKFTSKYTIDFTEEIIIGDANSDGEVNSIDYAKILRALLRVTELTENEIIAADLDGNGKINSIDYSYMKQYLLGKITEFPVER